MLGPVATIHNRVESYAIEGVQQPIIVHPTAPGKLRKGVTQGLLGERKQLLRHPIEFQLAAGGSGTFQIDTLGTSLAVSGLVSGSGDLIKTGAGTLGLGGANTYGGNTTISQGTLQVTADGALGTTAGLTQIGSSGTLQFSNVTYGTAETVRITGAGGTLDSLDGNNSFAGNVVLLANGTLSSSTPGKTLTLNGSVSSSGTVSELTVTGAGDMRLAGSVSGTFGLTKLGSGVVTLSASNTYAGDTTVSGGTLRLGANDVIPDGTGHGNVAVNGTGTLDVNGFRDTLNGLSGNGTVDSTSGSGTLIVGNSNATSTFFGIIQNNGGSLALTKVGTGTLTLAGNNTYSGDTTIQAGTISISLNNNLGAATATLICDHGTLLQTASFTTTRPVRLDSGGGTLNVAPGVTRIQAGIVSGVGQLTKIGQGTWEPTAINTYTGGTYLHEGTLIHHTAGNLGPQPESSPYSSNYLYVDNGAHLLVDATYSAFPGRGLYVGVGGAVYGETSGQVNFRNGPMQNWPGTSGGLTFVTLGVQGLVGNNSFSGDVTVLNGTLSISRDVNLGNAANPVILRGGTTLQAADGRMNWEGPQAYPGGNGQVVAGTITTSRTVTLASGTVTMEVLNGANPQQNLSPLSPLPSHTNTLTLTGPVGGSGALSKTGPGILTLAADNTYAGSTTVHDGTLSLQGPNGRIGAISLAGGTLGGNGTVGAISVAASGTVSPGDGTGDGTGTAGILHSGDVTWNTDTTFLAELFNGSGPGSGHDQLRVAGGISLGHATLDFRPSFTPADGAQFTIVDNDGIDAVFGTFRDTLGNILTGGAVFTVGGRTFRISYAGGDGNDVVLTYQSAVTVAFASASGSGAETFPNPTIAVQLAASSSETVTVTYTVRGDSTATPGGVDYTLATPGTLTFSPGSTTQNIPITINHNPTFEADKVVNLVLSDPVNAQLGSLTVFTYTIVETDPAHPVYVWDGGSMTSNNWTDPINWETDTAPTGIGNEELVFGNASAARKASSVNDFGPGKAFGQIIFQDSGYTLSGQATTLNGGGIVAEATGTNTIALNVTLGDSQTWSTVASGTLDFNGSIATNGKVLTTAGAGHLNLSSQITGSGGLTAAGTGVVTLTGNNTYGGLTTVNAGTLIVRSASGLGSTAQGTVVDGGATLSIEGLFTLPEPLILNGNGSTGGGALMSGSGNTTLSGNVTLNSASEIGVVQAGGTLTIAGVVSGVSGADLAKLGSGTLILSNTGNTYSGDTWIQAGELRLGNAGVLPDGGRVTLANASGAVLNLNGHDETIGSLSGGGTLGGNVLLGTATLTLGGDDSSPLFSGNLSGSGGLTKTGTGTLTLAGQDAYTGNTTISNGTLKLGSNQALAPGNVAVAGRLDLAGYSGAIQGLTGSGRVDTTAGASTLTVGLGDASSTFVGQMINSSGLLTLAKTGSGLLTLSGSNSYSGGTLLNAGTLSIGADVNLGDLGGNLTMTNNATLRFTATLGTSRNVVLGVGGGRVDVPGAITVTAGGVISGTGRLTKVGQGTWEPTTLNTYTGGTYLHEGTIIQRAPRNLGPQPVSNDPFSNYLYVDNGAKVLVDATYSAFPGRGLYIGDGGAVYGETAGQTNFRQGPMVNSPGTTGGLTIDSLGIQGLGGDNTFTGKVTVLRGELSISRDVNLGNATNVVILKPGAELEIADGRDNWGGVSPFPTGNGAMVPGTFTTNRTITLDGGEALIGVLNTTSSGWSVNPTPVGYPLPPHVNTFTVASSIIGTGALNKMGPGSLTLTAFNTYTGTTTITDGTLLVNGPDGRIGVTALAGGILSGNGTVGAITMNTTGTVSPGNGTGNGTGSTGILHSGTVTWNANTAFRVEVNGNTPGTDHDQLQVAGNVSLGDATLTLSRAVNYVPTGTGVLVIIDNDGSDVVGGTFQGLAEGAAVTLPGDAFPVFTISYVGGDGNDVVLNRRVPTGIYVDDAWAGTPIGTNPNYDPIGGLIFGYNAFATPQAALDQVAIHGTVTVYGGSYGGAAVNQTLTEIVVATNPYLPAESTVQLAGAVTLGASTTFRETGATNLVFASTVRGTTAGHQALTITGSNGLTFQGPVGTVAVPLASLTTGAGLNTAIDGGGVQTTGDQAYGGAVTVGANATLATSTGDITFDSTLNSAANGANTLSVSSGTGDLTFTAAVGSGTNQELGALTIASAADVTFLADARTAGNLTQTSGTGTTSFHGVSVVGDSLSVSTRHIALDAGNLAVANRTTFQASNAGSTAVSQAAGTTLLTTDLLLLGNGTFTLDQPLNHISGNLAANVLGSLSYRDAGSLQIGTVGATSGLTTGNATLTIQAQDSIGIGSSAALNAGTGHLTLTAETGSIDGSGLLTADLLTLQAVSGIGSTTALRSNVTTLDAVNSGTSGSIQIDEVSAGGPIGVQQLAQSNASGTGSIRLTAANGTLTVLAGGSGVSTLGAGDLTLTANGAAQDVNLNAAVSSQRGTITITADGGNGSGLYVNAPVTSQQGPIRLRADQDVRGLAAGTVTSHDGSVEITANYDTTSLGLSNDGTIAMAGDIAAGAGTVTFSLGDCSGYLDGNIVSAGDVIKNGVGALRLNGGHNTYTGATTINNGTWLINGTLVGAGGAVTVTGTPSGTLGGNGTIDRLVNVNGGGTLDPGDCDPAGSTPTCGPQPGRLTVNGDVVFQSGATFRVQLNGVSPAVMAPLAAKYDQLAVNGTVNLGGTVHGANGATLVTSVFPMPVGAAFRVIDNNLADTIDTQFNGLGEDAFFTAGGYVMNISYQSGSDNNDVTLTHPGRYDFDAYLPDTDPYYYESVGPMYPGNTAQ
ncbi:MAG: autotransporter-associated beta strand repeat-containing protein, partial [Planctomycetota bacterium]|nr:autotransporter-associated beta strand repeat-containing protein [Planctomycetota bacterium]